MEKTINNIYGEKYSKNNNLDSNLMRYGKKELLNSSEIISLPKNERKLKFKDCSLNKIVKNLKQEELIEELMIDLSSLLVKLKNSLEEYQAENCAINIKKNVIDLVRVCISVGLRVGGILEEKCKLLGEDCIVLSKYSLSYNWFIYWNDNFPKSTGISNDIQEFNEIEMDNIISQNKNNIEEYHVCTVNCVKHEKFISDFKMLSKIANNLFNQAFIMSIWNTKNDNFIEIEYYNINNNVTSILENDIYYADNQDNDQILNDNKLINTNFEKKSNIDHHYSQNQNSYKLSIDDNELNVDEIDYDEEISDNLSNNFNYILLPEVIVCPSSIHDFNSNKSISEVNHSNSNSCQFSEIQFSLINQSRRASIVMENIDIESLIECKNKVTNIKHSMIKIREVQTEIYKLIIESTGEIDYLEEQSALAQINTAQGASSVAKGSKSKANWWPFHGSTAGLVCGGAAGLILGPIGVSFGAAIGGALGLTFGNMIKNHCHEKMDDIIKECEARTTKKKNHINSNQIKNNEQIMSNINFISENQTYFKTIINKKMDEKYQLLFEVKDNNKFNHNHLISDSNSMIEEKYDKYISKATLSDILENVDIIP
ncbi:Glycine zipper-containing protein [Cryptosporidium tyzzeri]|nr:Glycine zipper-containing protein [Cryptosporidium tyzzeri]